MAEDLISNPDTGERRIAGDIVSAKAVKGRSHTRPNGSRSVLWAITINVGGVLVSIGHNTDPDQPAESGGLYIAFDATAEEATSFPQAHGAPAREIVDGAAIRMSRECVT